MNLKTYIEKGVKELSVSNGQAVAVNPYEWTSAKEIDRFLTNQEVADNNNHTKVFMLPPLPCAESVKEGTYPIERFIERYRIWVTSGDTDEDWEWLTLPNIETYQMYADLKECKTEILLVLSEPVAESEKPCPDCSNGLLNYGENDIRDCPTCKGGGMIKSEPVAEIENKNLSKTDMKSQTAKKEGIRRLIQVCKDVDCDKNPLLNVEVGKKKHDFCCEKGFQKSLDDFQVFIGSTSQPNEVAEKEIWYLCIECGWKGTRSETTKGCCPKCGDFMFPNEVAEKLEQAIKLPHLEIGDSIMLYGKETKVTGFEVVYNEGLEDYEIILNTTGRCDPFLRTLPNIKLI